MDATVPLWLLDVDGVLCPVGGYEHGPFPHNHGTTPAQVSEAAGMWTCWDATTVETITRLHTDGLVDVVWVTTWGEAAHELGQVLGLPRFPVLDLPTRTGRMHPKFAAGVELLRSHAGRPYVWTDDHLTRPVSSAINEALTDREALLIQPVKTLGLTSAHLRRIEKFVRAQRTGPQQPLTD